MKSEVKNDPELFVKSHNYIINLVISIKNKISFFPDMRKQEQGYYRELYYNDLVEKIKEQYPSDVQLIAIKENQSIIYVVKKGMSIFICEGSGRISVSQIKMEFNEFIDEFQKQGKYKKFFSSIFDW
ncbi:MAG: hypothetical protein HQK73_09340 [Desulfamplus sp.]|nr:hypothetical protein [Desulfamplus sp.]MBF0411204.1 hypothetical protein [Desulfamplus sp.]